MVQERKSGCKNQFKKVIKMTKKEKIIAICFIISFFMVIISSIYTANLNKPDGYEFKIVKLFKSIIAP